MAEGKALLRIFQRGFEGALRDTRGLCGDSDATAVEGRERHFVAFTFVANAIHHRDRAIGEDQFAARGGTYAELLFFLANFKARSGFFYHDRGDSFFTLRWLGVDVNDGSVGGAAIGDPCFGSVQNVIVAAFDGFGLQCCGVRAGLRLG